MNGSQEKGSDAQKSKRVGNGRHIATAQEEDVDSTDIRSGANSAKKKTHRNDWPHVGGALKVSWYVGFKETAVPRDPHIEMHSVEDAYRLLGQLKDKRHYAVFRSEVYRDYV
jgi:hypothetical protein